MVVETAKHASADRIRIAQLTGTAERHAALKIHGGYDRQAAIAELHSISTNPHLLAHAIGSTRHWMYRTLRALLLEAGAAESDMDEIAAAIDERLRARGFPIGHVPDGAEPV